MQYKYNSLAAVSQESTKSFLKLAVMAYVSYDMEYEPNDVRLLTLFKTHSAPFAARFKLTKLIDAVHRGLATFKDPNVDDTLDNAITDLFEALGVRKKDFESEHDITRSQLSLLNDLRLAHRGSEPAKKRLLKNVSTLGDPRLSKMFLIEEDDGRNVNVYESLESLVKRYGKVRGHIMPTEILTQWQDHAKAKGTKLKQHTKYLELRREVNEIFKKALANIVRGSGEPYLPLRDVISQLESKGIIHNLPQGFVGNIDDQGKFYTTAGKRLLQSPSGDVRMNGSYDAENDNAYVCEFTPPFAQAPTRAYTEDYRTSKRAAKFSVVSEVLPKIPSLTKKWLPELKHLGKTKEALLATICEFIYSTSARVGNKNAQSGGERTFGTTQFLFEHVKVRNGTVTVTYTGKSSGAQKHVVRSDTTRGKILVNNIVKLLEGKKKGDYVFTFRGRTVNSAAVNRYMHSVGFPKDFTVRNLRTARASQMAQDILTKCPYKRGDVANQSKINKWVESELLKVGAELGHMNGSNVTANTAIQNYISPEILADFYTKLGVRPSSKIQKAIDSIKKGE